METKSVWSAMSWRGCMARRSSAMPDSTGARSVVSMSGPSRRRRCAVATAASRVRAVARAARTSSLSERVRCMPSRALTMPSELPMRWFISSSMVSTRVCSASAAPCAATARVVCRWLDSTDRALRRRMTVVSTPSAMAARMAASARVLRFRWARERSASASVYAACSPTRTASISARSASISALPLSVFTMARASFRRPSRASAMVSSSSDILPLSVSSIWASVPAWPARSCVSSRNRVTRSLTRSRA